jgi:hypothetical protein
MLKHFPVYITMNKFFRFILTFAIGRTMVLKAARYSASPIGGERPPDHARFTVKPTPSPTPHCNNRKTESISTTLFNVTGLTFQLNTLHMKQQNFSYRKHK